MTDLRYAIRTLTRTPGLTALSILTLGLGLGVNTAIFSVVYAVLLRPLPYPDPGALVAVYESLPARPNGPAERRMAITPPTTRDWSRAASFASVSYYAEGEFILTGDGEPVRIPGANVSATFFDTLGVPPTAGRAIAAADTLPEAPLVCMISDDLWRTRFGADPGVVGRRIDVSGRPHAVVGIAAPDFEFPSTAEVWVPLAIPEEEYADDQRLSFYLSGVARLRTGVTAAQAEAELSLIASRLAAQHPKQYEGRAATVESLQETAVAEVRPALLLLLGTAGCVLLIACVNVANLLLGRTAARADEIATRAALGASRSRLLKGLLTESVLLALGGAAAGLLLAMWARDAIVSLSPTQVPRLTEVAISPAVTGFAVALAGLTSLAFGLAPALAATRGVTIGAIGAGRKGTVAAGHPRVRGTLVVVQLALSLALLTGAGLLARTFWNLMTVHTGFDPSSVLTMELVLPTAKYREPERRAAFFAQVVETLQAHPLIEAAGGATNLPLSSTNMSFGFYRQDMTPDRDPPHIANVRGVTAGYFAALRIPVLRGRAIGPEDRAGSTPVVVINDALRRKFWPDGDPIGQRLSITRGRTIVWREIVGVVGDIRHAGLAVEPQPEIYMPHGHDPFPFLRIAVRSDAPREALAGAMRAAVWAADRAQPVSRVRTMHDVIAASVASQRFMLVLLGSFAALALVLAAVGLYSVVAYSVLLRRHEFGVRVALGAQRGHVLALVARQSLALGGAGLVLGLGLAALATRLIESQLYGLTRHDPGTLTAVAGLLLVILVAATIVPARRALSVDPIRALRAE